MLNLIPKLGYIRNISILNKNIMIYLGTKIQKCP